MVILKQLPPEQLREAICLFFYHASPRGKAITLEMVARHNPDPAIRYPGGRYWPIVYPAA